MRNFAPSSSPEAPPQSGTTTHGLCTTTTMPPDPAVLFAEFQPLVRRLIRQYGEDPELRQDLVGEIYCRFRSLVEAYDPERGVPLRPYLVHTLPASVYTFTRSQWRRQQREVALETDGGLVDGLPVTDPTPEWGRQVLLQESLRELPRAIAALPLRQRQVVISRYYEALSFEEIALRMRVRPATARSLLRHGLNNLRRTLDIGEAAYPW
jgi:RNA polymerase sigma factor (sigma-70 family)